jgi:hypothetical protein
MRTLSITEIHQVAGGELQCTVNGQPCTGGPGGAGSLFANAYDLAVAAATDAMEAFANWLKD